MWRLARIAIMWLLAAAVPLQGVAAATMMHCGSAEHGQFHLHAVVPGHEDGDAADAPTMHEHPHATGVSTHGHSQADHSDAGKSGLAHSQFHKCSACASCCANAAVPTQASAFEAVDLADFFTPFVARSVAAYVTEGLERPPRTFLA